LLAVEYEHEEEEEVKLLLARDDIKGDSKDDRGPGKHGPHGKEQEICSRYYGDTRKGQQGEQTSKPPRRRQRGGSAGANGSHRQITRHRNRKGEHPSKKYTVTD
jgi:hypothetical protein